MSSPMQPFESQNLKDDDGPVLDSLFIETDTPPDLKALQDPIIVKQLKDPPVITRIVSGELTIDPAKDWGPQQIIVSDARRKYLFMRVESPTAIATDGFRVSDDQGTVKKSGIVLHGKTIQMDPHTGTVYVYPASTSQSGIASAPVSISWWAVTE